MRKDRRNSFLDFPSSSSLVELERTPLAVHRSLELGSMVICEVCGQNIAPFATRRNVGDGTEPFSTECACGWKFVGTQPTPPEAVTAEESSTSLTQRTSTRGEGPAQTVAECMLLLLLPTLLGHVWPAERVVIGLRVCKQLRRELMVHCSSIALAQRGDTEVGVSGCLEDFRRLPEHVMVRLRWKENRAEKLAGVLGECKGLTHLDLSLNGIGDEGASLLAGVLGSCKALAHLELGWNCIGDEGAWRLAGVLGECKALAHLDLNRNFLRTKGAGSLAG
eukprot:413778-Rhodomonas_salina.1